jgi:hypothetical protein
MRNVIRAVLGITTAVLAVLGGFGAGESHRPADPDVNSVSTH